MTTTFTILDRPGLLIRTAPLGAFATNCYVIACAQTLEGAIVDCSAEPDRIQAMIAHTPTPTIAHLLQTHAHIDHVVALPDLHTSTEAPIYLHRDDMPLYDAAPMQSRMFGIPLQPLPPPDIFLAEGDTVTLGELTARVLLTPGHTPGSICFYFEAQSVIFSGDVLFAGSIGRTDLPGGHLPTMRASLSRLCDELPDDTLVLSGHGPPTTMGREKATNPFLT
ncbi:MAG: MBL fold metallo-hydrolase [Myxococcota bacterium]